MSSDSYANKIEICIRTDFGKISAHLILVEFSEPNLCRHQIRRNLCKFGGNKKSALLNLGLICIPRLLALISIPGVIYPVLRQILSCMETWKQILSCRETALTTYYKKVQP